MPISSRIEWIRCKPRELDDREDIVVLFSSDAFGTMCYSHAKNVVYKIQGGFWYLSNVVEEDA